MPDVTQDRRNRHMLFRAGRRWFCVHCVMAVWLTGRAPGEKCAVEGCGDPVGH